MDETGLLEKEDELSAEESTEINQEYEPENEEEPEMEETEYDDISDEIIYEYESDEPEAESELPDFSAAEERVVFPAKKRTYTIGLLSAAAALIFTGIILFISLISPVEAFSAIAFAPFILVFIGAEIIYAMIRRRTLSVSIDIKSVIIAAVLIILSFIMSAIPKAATPAEIQRMHTSDKITREIKKNISSAVTCSTIKSVDAELKLTADDPTVYSSPEDLMNGDIINLTVNFSDAQISIREFAADCRTTLDELETLGYDFGTVTFIADDGINRYTLPVDWLYHRNFSKTELSQQVLFFADQIIENDINDIKDIDE